MHHPSVDFAAISHDCRPRLSTRAALLLARAKPFEFPADTFSFSNALYFDYQVKPGGGLKIQKRATGKVPDYSRHCFTLVRAVLQFYKYAEFRPHLPRVSDEEYRQRILQLSRIPVWSAGPKEKIQFPGYADLHSFSADHTLVLQRNLALVAIFLASGKLAHRAACSSFRPEAMPNNSRSW